MYSNLQQTHNTCMKKIYKKLNGIDWFRIKISCLRVSSACKLLPLALFSSTCLISSITVVYHSGVSFLHMYLVAIRSWKIIPCLGYTGTTVTYRCTETLLLTSIKLRVTLLSISQAIVANSKQDILLDILWW